MSSGRVVEPAAHSIDNSETLLSEGKEPADSKDDQKDSEEQEGAVLEEQNNVPPAQEGDKILEPVGKGEEQTGEEVEKSPEGSQDAQEMNGEQVNQEHEAAPASNDLEGPCQGDSGGAIITPQRIVISVQHPQRSLLTEKLWRHGPFFFFGGRNGASIIVLYCENKGWHRIYDKTRMDYKLKWCEMKSQSTYNCFRAGEQLVFQIPNNKVLTTKIGLLNSLREYERISGRVNCGQRPRRLRMEDFIPETYRMDVREEREAFFSQQELRANKGEMWICKPTGLNQGRGIFLLQTSEDIRAFKIRLKNAEDNQINEAPYHMPKAEIVQRYLRSPLLIKGRKFDVRSYFLIACTSPYMVFFRHGYVRLTCDLYDPTSNNLTSHLTNQYMQKKNPLYSVVKEDTVWSMEQLNLYVNDHFMVSKNLPLDWVFGSFEKQMQQIMLQCFQAVKAKLECKLGYFDLIGCDFIIDEDFKVWLLEMNCNPALHTNCEVLKEVVPKTVTETLDLVLEIFNKCRYGRKLLPLTSLRDFVLLYCGDCFSQQLSRQRNRPTWRLAPVSPESYLITASAIGKTLEQHQSSEQCQ